MLNQSHTQTYQLRSNYLRALETRIGSTYSKHEMYHICSMIHSQNLLKMDHRNRLVTKLISESLYTQSRKLFNGNRTEILTFVFSNRRTRYRVC